MTTSVKFEVRVKASLYNIFHCHQHMAMECGAQLALAVRSFAIEDKNRLHANLPTRGQRRHGLLQLMLRLYKTDLNEC